MVIYAALKSTIVLNENTVRSAISRRPVPAEFYPQQIYSEMSE